MLKKWLQFSPLKKKLKCFHEQSNLYLRVYNKQMREVILWYRERKIQFFNAKVNIYDSWKDTLNTYDSTWKIFIGRMK